MKTVTRCLGCHTAFRVHREQLEAREGYVRCGACGLVFDARAMLEVLGDEAEAPMRREESGTPEVNPDETRVPASAATPLEVVTVPSLTDAAAGETQAEQPATPEAGAASALDTEPLFAEETVDEDHPPAHDERGGASAHRIGESPFADTEEPAKAESEDVGVDFGEERRALQRRTLLWGVACIPLALVLAAQAALHWRAELAMLFPWSRGTLEALCAPFGCEVGLPRHANLLALEGANLEAEGGGVLTLYATLRNRAHYEQALPAIELTLTDAREQPVARRLLGPGEYAPTAHGIPAGGEITVRVSMDATAGKAAGFRAEVLYP